MAYCLKGVQHDAVYLTQTSDLKTNVLYKNVPLVIACTLTTGLSKSASIDRYKVNHSLRVTMATRLFWPDMDKHLTIMRIDHWSTDGEGAYKHISDGQYKC